MKKIKGAANKKMSHFEEPQKLKSNNGIVITSDIMLYYGLIIFLILGIFIALYLFITRCTRYCRGRLEDWGRELVQADKNE